MEQVALAWLFVRKTPNSKDLEKVLAPFSGQRGETAKTSTKQVLARFKSQGFIKPRAALRLNDAGKAHALDALRALGVEGLPSKVDWDWVKKLIVLRELGLPVTPAALKNVGDSEWLMASVLCARLGIPFKGAPSLRHVGQALVWRELGGDEASPFNVDTAFGSIALRGSAQPPPNDALPTAAPGHDSAPPAPTSPDAPNVPPVDDLDAFAERVMKAARSSSTGRWHDTKVFISHVWEELCRQGNAGNGTFEAFQKRLVAAHQARRLTLSRADLVEAMPPADVKASETTYLDSTFHFVRVDGG